MHWLAATHCWGQPAGGRQHIRHPTRRLGGLVPQGLGDAIAMQSLLVSIETNGRKVRCRRSLILILRAFAGFCSSGANTHTPPSVANTEARPLRLTCCIGVLLLLGPGPAAAFVAGPGPMSYWFNGILHWPAQIWRGSDLDLSRADVLSQVGRPGSPVSDHVGPMPWITSSVQYSTSSIWANGARAKRSYRV